MGAFSDSTSCAIIFAGAFGHLGEGITNFIQQWKLWAKPVFLSLKWHRYIIFGMNAVKIQ
jgi:hypothetical protein